MGLSWLLYIHHSLKGLCSPRPHLYPFLLHCIPIGVFFACYNMDQTRSLSTSFFAWNINLSTGLSTLSLCLQLWTFLPFRPWLHSILIWSLKTRLHWLFLSGTVCQLLPAIWPEWPTMPCQLPMLGTRLGCRLISTATHDPQVSFLLPRWWPPWNPSSMFHQRRKLPRQNQCLRKNRPAPEVPNFEFPHPSTTPKATSLNLQLRYGFPSMGMTWWHALTSTSSLRWPVSSGLRRHQNYKLSKTTRTRFLLLLPRLSPRLDFRNGWLRFYPQRKSAKMLFCSHCYLSTAWRSSILVSRARKGANSGWWRLRWCLAINVSPLIVLTALDVRVLVGYICWLIYSSRR